MFFIFYVYYFSLAFTEHDCYLHAQSRNKKMIVNFRPVQNRGGSPAWASMVEVKDETFCECIRSKHPENNHETRLLLFNASKKTTYCKTC